MTTCSILPNRYNIASSLDYRICYVKQRTQWMLQSMYEVWKMRPACIREKSSGYWVRPSIQNVDSNYPIPGKRIKFVQGDWSDWVPLQLWFSSYRRSLEQFRINVKTRALHAKLFNSRTLPPRHTKLALILPFSIDRFEAVSSHQPWLVHVWE